VLRYETKPGVQAQVDWGELGTIEVDGTLKKLFCFNMILGYSRMRYVEFTLNIDTPTLIQCHLDAFEYFGGFIQEILYDNMKQVVIKRALSHQILNGTHSLRISSNALVLFHVYAGLTGLRQKAKLKIR
jgi:transposase